MTMKPLLKPVEVADAIGITVKQLNKWRSKGKGPRALRLSPKVIRYFPEDVETWVAQHCTGN